MKFAGKKTISRNVTHGKFLHECTKYTKYQISCFDPIYPGAKFASSHWISIIAPSPFSAKLPKRMKLKQTEEKQDFVNISKHFLSVVHVVWECSIFVVGSSENNSNSGTFTQVKTWVLIAQAQTVYPTFTLCQTCATRAIKTSIRKVDEVADPEI